MRDTIEKTETKEGKHGMFQKITTVSGNTFFNNKKPFPTKGEEIEYEVKDANGYNWTTKLEIIIEDKVDPVMERIANALESIALSLGDH